MMDKLKQAREAKAELTNPHESDRIRALADVLAEIQTEQRAAVMDQRDTLGVEAADDVDRLDKEERVAEIIDLVDGYGPGGPSLSEVWIRQCGPEELDGEEAAQLAHYAEMTPEEWDAQIERWADTYRANGADSMHSDRSLADAHTVNTWGISLSRFEAEVVEFDRATALTDILAGASEATEAAIRANTEGLQ
ncbi:hypothetical protein [Haloarcula marina]|uniref:hypothetical protein n=1 Tax=Haloarcula marina TaxID=2961574 RepID=UPI0020B6617C|nr:hypothetical protein [Halomicroarcula marina]